LIAAHKILVRVSADLFVEESLIHFDVERVDEVISVYCPGGFIPLKSVTDFSIFLALKHEGSLDWFNYHSELTSDFRVSR